MLHPFALLAAAGSITCSLVSAAVAPHMSDEEPVVERRTTIMRSNADGTTTVMQSSGAIVSTDGNVIIMPADGAGFVIGDGTGGNGPMVTFASAGPFSMPGHMAELLRPEFLRRDARLYEAALQLHQSQLPIIRLLLESYTEEFDEAATDLRAALDRRRRSRMLDLTGGLMMDEGSAISAETLAGIAMPAIRATGSAVAIDLESGASTAAVGGGEVVGIRVARRASDSAAATGDESGGSAGDRSEDGTGAMPRISVSFSQDAGQTIELKFDDGELAALAARINERMQRARQRGEEARARLEAEGPLPTAAEVHEMARQFRVMRETLAAQFKEDLSLILAEWQQELLEHAHDLQRLDAQLPHGRLSGESLDLRALVEQIAPRGVETESLGATLAPWIRETAQMLVERMHHAIELELGELRNEADVEEERAPQHARTLSLARNVAAARERITAQSEEILQMLLRMVDDADAALLLQEARRRAFPSIFRTSQVLAVHDQAIAVTEADEDPALHDAIAAMRSEYALRLNAFNDRLVTLTRASDTERLMLPYELRTREAALHSSEAPARMHEEIQAMMHAAHGATSTVMNDRTKAALAAIDLLRSVLGDERFEQLPGAASFPRRTR